MSSITRHIYGPVYGPVYGSVLTGDVVDYEAHKEAVRKLLSLKDRRRKVGSTSVEAGPNAGPDPRLNLNLTHSASFRDKQLLNHRKERKRMNQDRKAERQSKAKAKRDSR